MQATKPHSSCFGRGGSRRKGGKGPVIALDRSPFLLHKWARQAAWYLYGGERRANYCRKQTGGFSARGPLSRSPSPPIKSTSRDQYHSWRKMRAVRLANGGSFQVTRADLQKKGGRRKRGRQTARRHISVHKGHCRGRVRLLDGRDRQACWLR